MKCTRYANTVKISYDDLIQCPVDVLDREYQYALEQCLRSAAIDFWSYYFDLQVGEYKNVSG
jgi:hypothetical protein